MNPAEAAVAKLIGARLGAAGSVRAVALGRGSLRLTLDLVGQGGPVEIAAEGLRWEPDGDRVIVRWDRLSSTLPWVDALLADHTRRAGGCARLADGLRLAPLKFLLPRA